MFLNIILSSELISEKKSDFIVLSEPSEGKLCDSDFDIESIDSSIFKIDKHKKKFDLLKNNWKIVQPNMKQSYEIYEESKKQLDKVFHEYLDHAHIVTLMGEKLFNKREELRQLLSDLDINIPVDELIKIVDINKLTKTISEQINLLQKELKKEALSMNAKFDTAQHYYNNVWDKLWKQLNSSTEAEYAQIKQKFLESNDKYNELKDVAIKSNEQYIKNSEHQNKQLKIYQKIIDLKINVYEHELYIEESEQDDRGEQIDALNEKVPENFKKFNKSWQNCVKTESKILKLLEQYN